MGATKRLAESYCQSLNLDGAGTRFITVRFGNVLGSTGSIGVNTLDVLRQHSDKYEVYALAANTSVASMLEQCREFEPRLAVMMDEGAIVYEAAGAEKSGLTVEALVKRFQSADDKLLLVR